MIHRNAEFTNFFQTVLYQENTAVFYDTPVGDSVGRHSQQTTGNASNPVFIHSLWKPFLVSRLKDEEKNHRISEYEITVEVQRTYSDLKRSKTNVRAGSIPLIRSHTFCDKTSARRSLKTFFRCIYFEVFCFPVELSHLQNPVRN